MDKEFTLIMLAQRLFGENRISFEHSEECWWCNIAMVHKKEEEKDIKNFELLNDVALSCNCKLQFNLK